VTASLTAIMSRSNRINVFDGKIKGADLELERTVHIPFSMPTTPKKTPTRP